MKVHQLAVQLPELDDNTPEYLSRPVPPDTFPLHLLAAIIGGRGSGKTTMALKLIKLYDKHKSFDRIVFFSTTADKDPKVRSFLEAKSTFAEVSAHSGYSDDALREEMDRMEGDLQDWRQYKAKRAAWKRFVAAGHDVDKLSYEDVVLLHDMDLEPPKPPNKSGMYPCHLVVFDDLVGQRVFHANMGGLANRLLISHRHYSASVMILSQTFTSFIPKPVRTNNISLWVLFSCKCEKAMKEIAEDVAAKISPDQFVAAWKFATRAPHTPLVCDYDTHDPKRRFRMGIDRLLVFEDAEEGNASAAGIPDVEKISK